tara:strand:- start:6283 stop:8727 length:2445 start_codon:yes stop_codon:yes gene_type:complete
MAETKTKMVRVVQIAKELNISHQEIISLLKKKNIEVKSHMSPVDAKTYQIIIDEFDKDRLLVERYKKERVRKKIHHQRLEEKLKESYTSTFEIIMPAEQKILEEKLEKKAREELIALEKERLKNQVSGKSKIDEILKKKADGKNEGKSVKRQKPKDLKLRKIDLSEIGTKIDSSRKKPAKPAETPEGSSKDKSIRSTVKRTIATLDTKSKKKKYKKERVVVEDETEGTRKVVKIKDFMSVQELSMVLDISPSKTITNLLTLGIPATMNQRLGIDEITLLAEEAGFGVEKVEESIDDFFDFEDTEEDIKKAIIRAPVVTIMGHVDHGKTSLLDYIRNSNVVAGEAGGITQHIGAYEVTLDNGRNITFLDTPGHEAFTAMRARGAQVTDVVILIVAADDGVKPQTIEAINHAKAAEVPLMVVINKIDKNDADPDRVKTELSEQGILVEDWGGKYQCVDVSAKTGDGVDSLLELLALETDILELKANPETLAKGIIIESRMEKGHGIVGTMIVQKGTLRVGDPFICGTSYGKVRAILNERNVRIKEAYPSDPAQIIGFEKSPQSGDRLVVVSDEKEGKRISTEQERVQREIHRQMHTTKSLDKISEEVREGLSKKLSLIIKTDVEGSIEALVGSLSKIDSDEVKVQIVHTGVGTISESDILLASASGAIVLGFNINANSNAKLLAEKEGVEIRNYTVIYDAINEIKLALEGLLEPEYRDEITGKAEILQVFNIGKLGNIAGCKVIEGKINKSDTVRVSREGEILHKGSVSSLKHFQDDVKEVIDGKECGIGVEGFKKYEEGDIIEAFVEKEVKRTLA